MGTIGGLQGLNQRCRDNMNCINHGFLVILIFFGIMKLCPAAKQEEAKVKHKCDKLDIPQCKDLHQYNKVYYPNLIGHHSQSQAKTFQLFLKAPRCGIVLQTFLCYLLAPPCESSKLKDSHIDALPPCHQVCNDAKRKCKKLMRGHGLTWPADFDCSQFPHDHCMDTYSNFTTTGKVIF